MFNSLVLSPYCQIAVHHAEPYHEEPPKDYQFGYDVHGVDAYGNPNEHSRVESRVGPTVKGEQREDMIDYLTWK